ncbi:MAG: hypothetical protein IJ034_00360 [Mailhella sp.]|nr:hypothetical protein [Mailhella sp.]
MSQPRLSFLLRTLILLWAVVLLPLPLWANPEGSAPVQTDAAFVQTAAAETAAPAPLGDTFAEPAPVLTEPEPVTLRADIQPAPEAGLQAGSFVPSLMVPASAEAALHVEEEEQDPSQIDLSSVLTMLVDENALTFEDAAGRFSEFQPYDARALLRQSGVLWLHLALDNVAHDEPGSLRLDLGDQLPPGVEVWLSSDGIRWKLAAPEDEGVYGLAYAGNDGQALIRMDGMPGLWFCPALRPLALALGSPERGAYDTACAMLTLLSGLCFFLCIGLRGESRFWTFILASAAAVQSHWAIPATASGIGVEALPGIFAAGVSLLMLPHIGRVLMRTRIVSPASDVFFMVLALMGVCAALLPLVPGMGWVARLLILWPLAAVLCALPSMVLLVRGVHGSLPFTLACLAMGGGAVFAVLGLARGMEAPLWGTAVLYGPVLGILLLTSASPLRSRGAAAEGSAQAGADALDAKSAALETMRQSVKGAVEGLLDEACRLDQALDHAGADPAHVEVMARADSLVASARRLSESVMGEPDAPALPGACDEDFDLRRVIQSVFSSVFQEAENKGLGLSWYVSPHLGRRYRGDSARLTALLSLLLSDAVRASKNAPAGGAVSLRVRRASGTHPGHLLFTVADTGEGQPPHGRSSQLLARLWDWASAHGGELFVSGGPHGTEVAFSIVCTAYEEDGVTVRPVPGEALKAPEKPEAPRKGRRKNVKKDAQKDSQKARLASRLADKVAGKLVIAASSVPVNRQMMSHYLEGMGLRVWEACDAAEAAALYAVEPAALVILDGTLAEEDMVNALAAVRMLEGERSLPAVPFLLLARDVAQAERMSKAGCDEGLLPPLLRKDLRAMVKWMTAPAGTLPKPVLSSQRVTLAALLAGASSGALRLQRKEGLKKLRSLSQSEGQREEQGEAVNAAPAVTPAESAPALDEAQNPAVAVTEEAVETAVSAAPDTPEVSAHAMPAPEVEVPEVPAPEIPAEAPAPEAASAAPEISAPAPAAPVLQPDEAEDYAPVERIAQGLDAIKAALDELDATSVRRGSAALASIAESCGMHTLADMARCFRAAWEEGDLEAAAQIVEEMRAENARNSRTL